MEIKKKIPRSHREMLQELYDKYERNNNQLEKEAKHELIGVFAGSVGLLITFFWLIEPLETTAAVGDLGLTLSFIAMIVGVWVYFAPPSKNKTRQEYYIIRSTNERLDKFGYDPTIEFGEVRIKGEQTYSKISEDSSYEDAEIVSERSSMRFFLVDGSIPAIELADRSMLLLRSPASSGWREIVASEVLDDMGSPEVSKVVVTKVTEELGGSMPDGV